MLNPPLFKNRREAGEKLARAVLAQKPTSPTVVYALPRGGLPIAEPIARCLGCPLDILVAKKITEPGNPELAVGAVTVDGYVLWASHKPAWSVNSELWRAALSQAHQQAQAQLTQLAPNSPVASTGAIAILVDDGIATGMTMAVAAYALRKQAPAAIWICAPVAPLSLVDRLHRWADRVIVLETPKPFWSVSRFYQEFPQIEIEEARTYLLN